MKLTIDDRIKEIPFYPKAQMYGFEEGWIRLSSNENAFPPSQKVLTSLLDALLHINRYPGGEFELKNSLAKKFAVTPEQVVIGNGSNELIEMSLRAMKSEAKDRIVISDPSFAFYTIAARIYGYETVKVPVRDMKVDLDLVADAVDSRTRIVFLNNPLNPTGTIFEEDALSAFLKKMPPEVLIVVDEAYAEFVESRAFPRTLSMIDDYPILILRTFSKAYGLAGLRVGYGIGNPAIVPFVERTKQPFSVNAMALIAAAAALMNGDYLQSVLNNNGKVKRFLYDALDGLGVQYVPSEANFVLLFLGHKAEAITKRLFDERVVVRWMGAYGLPEYVRVTLGRLEENRRFVELLKRILNEEARDHHR
jgi:histidinol-phosphate aminotransferase